MSFSFYFIFYLYVLTHVWTYVWRPEVHFRYFPALGFGKEDGAACLVFKGHSQERGLVVRKHWAVVGQVFNPSTRENEAGGSL